jgi:hypothetical protein
MEITINKFKLRDAMFGTCDYDLQTDHATDQLTRTCNNPVHTDLKDALQALAVHCILIDELVDVTKVKGSLENYNPALLQYVTVKGFTLGGDDGEGITISFERKLSTGRVINLNTPFTKFGDESIKYKFDDDLQLAVEDLVGEIKEYLAGTKLGDGAQLAMAMADGEEDESNPHL